MHKKTQGAHPVRLSVGVAPIALILLFAVPLLAGEVLMTQDGFHWWLMQKMLPREQRLDAFEVRVSALEDWHFQWKNNNLSRIYLWPDDTRVEYRSPGGVPAGTDNLDVPPRIVDGRTMVPLRFVGEAMGAVVVWDAGTSQVEYIAGERRVRMTVGQTMALVNDRPVVIDAAPLIVDGRTLVPIRFVSQCLGALVKWDDALRRVEIEYLEALG